MTEDEENLRKFLESDVRLMVKTGEILAKDIQAARPPGDGRRFPGTSSIESLYEAMLLCSRFAYEFGFRDDLALTDDHFEACVRELKEFGDGAAVESLYYHLLLTDEDEDRELRWGPTWALGKIGDESAVELLIILLHQRDREVRRYATEALGKIGNAQAVEPLIEMLSRDWQLEEEILEPVGALGEIGDTRAVEPLIELLDPTVWENSIVLSSAWALGEIGDTRAVEPLIKLLGEYEDDTSTSLEPQVGPYMISPSAVVDAAKEALKKLGHEV